MFPFHLSGNWKLSRHFDLAKAVLTQMHIYLYCKNIIDNSNHRRNDDVEKKFLSSVKATFLLATSCPSPSDNHRYTLTLTTDHHFIAHLILLGSLLAFRFREGAWRALNTLN